MRFMSLVSSESILKSGAKSSSDFNTSLALASCSSFCSSTSSAVSLTQPSDIVPSGLVVENRLKPGIVTDIDSSLPNVSSLVSSPV